MKKIDLDFNKIRAGMMMPTMIGIAVVFVGFLFNLILSIFSSIPIVNEAILLLAGLAGLIISLFGYLFFMLLFLWTGYRTAHKYRGDAVEAGITAAISYIIIAVVNLVFTLVLTILSAVELISYTAVTSGIGGEHSDIALALLGGGAAGVVGIVFNLCCSFGLMLVGGLINFVIGAVGGLIGEKK